MDEQEFKKRADQTLHALYKRLAAASDDAEFEADFNAGALAIEFEDAARQVCHQPQCAGSPDLGFGTLEELQAGLGRRPEHVSSWKAPAKR